MMQAVGELSKRILGYFFNADLLSDIVDLLYYNKSNNRDELSFGCFRERPSRGQVIKMLNDNNPENLRTIMFIHFQFARGFVRNAARYFYDDDRLYALVRNIDSSASIYNDRIYDEDLYYRDRGRGLDMHDVTGANWFDKEMGILTDSCEDFFSEGLKADVKENEYWEADSKYQYPDFSSKYVCSLIENDTPYVAGPSGMTSCFIASMMALTDEKYGFGDDDRREYLAAVTAYIVSGGFHSLHEVIGPIRYQLGYENIMPKSYEAEIAVEGALASPANYHEFYKMMMDIDPEFAAVREKGYANLDEFMNKNFADYKILEEYQEANDLIDGFKQGVDEYIRQKKNSNFAFRLMPDVSHGVKRASNYKKMLQDANFYEKIIIMYAMFKSSKGKSLKGVIRDRVDVDDLSSVDKENSLGSSNMKR